jgi:catechol 2,3-dioxygenase-like lactoylglutathione lyase family enzyme
MQSGAEVLEHRGAVLAGARVPFLFVHVDDVAAAADYYDQLGFRRVDGPPVGVAYDAGQVLLTLVPALEHGIALAKPHDDSTDVVFLVDDLPVTAAALERRGVVFERQRTYEIGAVMDFYDPDGHRLMLYEPSQHALETPAGSKIRALWRASGAGSASRIGLPATSVDDPDELTRLGFHGKPLIYLFHFIKALAPSLNFMEGVLGLEAVHRSPCCNHGCPDEQNAVVKYEGGGLLLSTHHMHGHEAVVDDHGNPYGARDFEPEHAKGIAAVFQVPRLAPAMVALERSETAVRMVLDRPDFGTVARVESPSGHVLDLYEPSPLVSHSAVGTRLREIARFAG